MNPGFFVPCYDCGEDIKVGAGTFRRVLAKQSWISCQACSPMWTTCAEAVGQPNDARSVEKQPRDRFTV